MLLATLAGCSDSLSDIDGHTLFIDHISRWIPESAPETRVAFIDNEWIAEDPPVLWSEEYFQYNHALDKDWSLSLEDGEIIVTNSVGRTAE